MRRAIAVLAVLLLLGGNAALVQALGWAGMLATRSATLGWRGAVASTFSGKAPCPMCCAARALRERPAPAAPAEPAKLLPLAAVLADATLPTLTSAPPAPHPRAALALPPDGRTPAPDPPPPRRA